MDPNASVPGTEPVRRLPATKVVATLGPATADLVPQLLDAGVSVMRLNLAHGTQEDHAARVGAVRAAAAAAGREVCILGDLPGPKVRLGALADGRAELAAGSSFTLHAGLATLGRDGDATAAATTHPRLAEDLRPGDHIHLSDGAVELVVREIGPGVVHTIVERGGSVRSRAGVNVPAHRLSLPAVSDRDRDLAAFAAGIGVDALGQSFVRTPEDVEELRAFLGPDGPAIVAKIETLPALDAIEAIAEAADAIMVARGDLGLELPFEAVPVAQKRLIATAVELGRPVIVATQMLESMLAAPRPTRAEASDVANAVLDGADAVMLSGETAIGAFPLLAAEAAIRIARAAETMPPGAPASAVRLRPEDGLPLAAVALAEADPGVQVLVVIAGEPRAVVAEAARRPRVPIIAVVADVRAARLLSAVRGVIPVVAPSGLAGVIDGLPARGLLADPGVQAWLPAGGRAVVVVAPAAGGSASGRLEVIDLGSDG